MVAAARINPALHTSGSAHGMANSSLANNQEEPSVEEILASIRRVIAADQGASKPAAAKPPLARQKPDFLPTLPEAEVQTTRPRVSVQSTNSAPSYPEPALLRGAVTNSAPAPNGLAQAAAAQYPSPLSIKPVTKDAALQPIPVIDPMISLRKEVPQATSQMVSQTAAQIASTAAPASHIAAATPAPLQTFAPKPFTPNVAVQNAAPIIAPTTIAPVTPTQAAEPRITMTTTPLRNAFPTMPGEGLSTLAERIERVSTPAAPLPQSSTTPEPHYTPEPQPRPSLLSKPLNPVFPDPLQRERPARASLMDRVQQATENERLLSQQTGVVVSDQFKSLSDAMMKNSETIVKDMISEKLNAMLRDWLDNNLPSIVEKLVRAEIERVSRGQM